MDTTAASTSNVEELSSDGKMEAQNITMLKEEGALNQQIFMEPQCLIDVGKDGKLHVVQHVISQLEALNKPLVVVAIAGLYRTGKSYLMNRLAGRRDGKNTLLFWGYSYNVIPTESCQINIQFCSDLLMA